MTSSSRSCGTTTLCAAGDADPELEAVRAAILLEDVFDVTLSDADIDPAVLADAPAVAALVARLRGTA